MANGIYAANLSDLDIEVPGEDVIDGMLRRDTQYFRYASKSLATGQDDQIAIAIRLPTGSNYVLVVKDDDSGIWCKGYNTDGVKNCKMLGAADATSVAVWYALQ